MGDDFIIDDVKYVSDREATLPLYRDQHGRLRIGSNVDISEIDKIIENTAKEALEYQQRIGGLLGK